MIFHRYVSLTEGIRRFPKWWHNWPFCPTHMFSKSLRNLGILMNIECICWRSKICICTTKIWCFSTQFSAWRSPMFGGVLAQQLPVFAKHNICSKQRICVTNLAEANLENEICFLNRLFWIVPPRYGHIVVGMMNFNGFWESYHISQTSKMISSAGDDFPNPTLW